MKIYPDDWKVRYTTGLISAGCILAAMLLGPVVGINGFWPFMLSIVVATVAGNFLGLLVCRRLFRSPAGGPSENQQQGSPTKAKSAP